MRFINCILYFLRFPFVLLISVIPKNKKKWVFGAWFGKKFADNPKYLFNYIRTLSDFPIKPVWICKDHNLIQQVKCQYGNEVEIYYHSSLRGIYYQITASVIFVGHGVSSDLNSWFISLTTKRIQMWHGVPLKKIGCDDEMSTRPWHRTSLYKLLSNNYYDFILSTGSQVSTLLSSAFAVSRAKVIETGYPRNDRLLRSADIINNKSSVSKLKFIYMPTFRDNIGDEISLFGDDYRFCFLTLEKFLAQNNIELTLRVHPVNKPPKSILKLIEKSTCISISNDDDIYQVIDMYDCLITDYSSIMFDFCLTNKPMIFAPFDLDKYLLEDRGMYFNYSEIINDYPFAMDWGEVMVMMGKISLEIRGNVSRQKNNKLLKFHDASILASSSFSNNVIKFILKQYYTVR